VAQKAAKCYEGRLLFAQEQRKGESVHQDSSAYRGRKWPDFLGMTAIFIDPIDEADGLAHPAGLKVPLGNDRRFLGGQII
jgi:hypothetical protein